MLINTPSVLYTKKMTKCSFVNKKIWDKKIHFNEIHFNEKHSSVHTYIIWIVVY